MVIEGESCCQLFLFYFSNKILSVFVKIQQNIQKELGFKIKCEKS